MLRVYDTLNLIAFSELSVPDTANGCLDGKVKFGNLGFSIGKRENSGVFRNYCSQ